MVIVETTMQQARLEVSKLKETIHELGEESHKMQLLGAGLIGLARKLSGSEDLNKVLALIQQVIYAYQVLQRTIQLFYATSGPLGWIMGGVSVLGQAFTVSEVFRSYC